MAMISVHAEMKKKQVKSKLILQVHDELVFDVHNSEEVLIQDLVRQAMEKAVKLSVPMQVELKLADNWLDAH
jgi:DNA polymerase-1